MKFFYATVITMFLSTHFPFDFTQINPLKRILKTLFFGFFRHHKVIA